MAALSQLFVELGLDASGFEKGLGKARGSLGGFGKAVAVGVGATAIAAVGVGVALFKIGDAYDSMSDHIASRRGPGQATEGARQDNAIDVFKTVPTTMEIAGDAIASVSAKTGDTGKSLEDLTASEIELARDHRTDLNSNIAESTKIFNAWGITGKDQTKTLDGLFNASQKYGVGVDELMGRSSNSPPRSSRWG
jgi:phage-related minor tail protein